MNISMEQTQFEQPSAQVLDKIPPEPLTQFQKNQPKEFNPDPKLSPLQSDNKVDINADVSDSPTMRVFWMVIAVVFLLCCMLSGFFAHPEIHFEGGLSSIIQCNNPALFDEDGSVKCLDFDPIAFPVVGTLISGVDNWNQYLQSRLLITRPTSINQKTKIVGTVSIYALKKGAYGFSYYKQETLLQNQAIDLQVQSVQIFDSAYSSPIKGFIADLPLVRPITANNYLVVVYLESAKMQYLETSIDVKITVSYISSEFVKFTGIVRFVCILILSLSTILYWCKTKQLQTFQRNLVMILSIAQCISLDPFILATLAKPNVFCDLLSSLLMTIHIGSVVAFASYIYFVYIEKQHPQRKHLIGRGLYIFVLLSSYFFATTFTQFKQIQGVEKELMQVIFALFALMAVGVSTINGFQILLRPKQFQSRHFNFLYLTHFILFAILGSMGLFVYRVYSSSIVAVLIPTFLTTYTLGIQYLYRPHVPEQCEELPPQSEINPTREEQVRDQITNQEPLDKIEKMEYFDIQGTEQLDNYSVKSGF